MATPVTYEDLQKILTGLVKGSLQESTLRTLQTNSVKLDGCGTFLTWSRNAKLILASRGLEGFITGKKEKPSSDGVEKEQWEAHNSLVMAWLLGSMVPEVARGVQLLKTVNEIWDSVSGTYSRKGDFNQAYEIQCKLYNANYVFFDRGSYPLRSMWLN